MYLNIHIPLRGKNISCVYFDAADFPKASAISVRIAHNYMCSSSLRIMSEHTMLSL